MTVNEQIVSGRKFRRLINESTNLWQRISFWTKASDVELNNGQTVEDALSNIKNDITNINNSITNDIITKTLPAGSTTITITNSKITTNSVFTFYTSIYGVNPNTVSVSNGSITMTFQAPQTVAMQVGVKIDG